MEKLAVPIAKEEAEESRRGALAMSVTEMAELLDISTASAYAAVKRGDVPHWRLNGRILIARTTVRRLLEGSKK